MRKIVGEKDNILCEKDYIFFYRLKAIFKKIGIFVQSAKINPSTIMDPNG